MNNYLLAKIAFITFGSTTVIIFLLLRFGDFVGLVGSIAMAIMIFAINTVLLIVSIVLYVWQRAHKDLPAHQKSEILEAFAAREAEISNKDIRKG